MIFANDPFRKPTLAQRLRKTYNPRLNKERVAMYPAYPVYPSCTCVPRMAGSQPWTAPTTAGGKVKKLKKKHGAIRKRVKVVGRKKPARTYIAYRAPTSLASLTVEELIDRAEDLQDRGVTLDDILNWMESSHVSLDDIEAVKAHFD